MKFFCEIYRASPLSVVVIPELKLTCYCVKYSNKEMLHDPTKLRCVIGSDNPLK